MKKLTAILNINILPIEYNSCSKTICVWQAVAMDPRKFHPGPPCLIFLCLVGGPPLKLPWGEPPAVWATSSLLLSLGTPHAVCLCQRPTQFNISNTLSLACFINVNFFLRSSNLHNFAIISVGCYGVKKYLND